MTAPDDAPNPFDAALAHDLDAVLARAWALLVRGAVDRRSGFHTIQLGTVSPDGPRVRTVVLRGVEPAARRLRVHTDARSSKLAEIAADPRVEICAYDPKAKIQLRLRGAAAIHRDDAPADAAWAASGPGSRVCYRARFAPGATLADPADADPDDAERAPADPDAGRANFTALLVTVARLDWLWLASSGHRRASFDWSGSAWAASWRAP